MAARKKKHWYARRPMGYNGREYARGQILVGGLAGARNDDKLIRLGYIAEHTGEIYEYEDNPEVAFVGEGERQAYGRTQDRVANLARAGWSADAIDDEITDQQIKQANEVAPVTLPEPAS